MTAQIIDGKALAEELRQSFKARVEDITSFRQTLCIKTCCLFLNTSIWMCNSDCCIFF